MQLTGDNFQELAFGQRFCNEIWGTLADYINVT
jgi:hypothetical protein